MRSVGKEVGAEAMSLYRYVRSKDDLLDALGDWIFAGIQAPQIDAPWREAMRIRAAEARATLAAHPWSLNLIESRRVAGAALLGHHDAVLGCLRANGFPVRLAGHAFSVLDAYVYGFVLIERNLPVDDDESVEEFVAEIDIALDDHPHLAEYVEEVIAGTGYAYAEEFEYGLDLVLDQLEVRLLAARSDSPGIS